MNASNYIRINNGQIDARLDVFIYEKDKLTFAYAPALDLIGYGHSEEEAKQSFEVVVEDYFEFGIKRNTLEKDLEAHGWIKEKKTEFEVPNIWNIIAQNDEVRAFASKDFQKRSVPFKQAVICS